MIDNDLTEDLLIVDRSDLDYVHAIASDHGVQVEEVESRGIEPVLTVTLILLGTSTAVATVARLIEQHKGGQVIDLRPQAPRVFYRSKDLLYGFVLVLVADGNVTVEVKEPRGMFGQVLDALKDIVVELGGSGVADVAAGVEARIGHVASIDTKPADGYK